MNRAIGIVFTGLYLLLAWVIGALLGLHGPDLLPYFVFGYLVSALVTLWLLVGRGDLKPMTLIAAALGIAVCLFVASVASVGPLVHWDVARMERRAAATVVSNMRDELLLSAKGNPIGIRLRYSMRFPDNNYFWQGVMLDPETDLCVGIWANGRIVGQTIEPPMRIAAVAPNPPPPNTRDPNFGVARRYEAGKLYNFTLDLLPYFLLPSQDKTHLCLVQPPPEYAAAFERLLATDSEVRFRISISGTNYVGRTGNTYNLRNFYRSAAKEGAPEPRSAGLGGSVTACQP